MQYLSRAELDEILGESLDVSTRDFSDPSSELPLICGLKYPSEPYRVYWFCKTLVGTFSCKKWLIWIIGTGVWPSSENWDLFDLLWWRNHDRGELSTLPGKMIEADEIDHLISLSQVCLLNGWDFGLLPLSGDVALWFSHDEYVNVVGSNSENLISAIRSRLGDFLL